MHWGIVAHGAIRSAQGASVDPYALAYAALRSLRDHGQRVHDRTNVVEFAFSARRARPVNRSTISTSAIRRPAEARALRRDAGRRLPGLELDMGYAWAGTFAESPDGLPFVGSHPSLPRCRFALGFGGNRISYSALAAQYVAADLAGDPDLGASMYRLDRADARPAVVGGRRGAVVVGNGRAGADLSFHRRPCCSLRQSLRSLLALRAMRS